MKRGTTVLVCLLSIVLAVPAQAHGFGHGGGYGGHHGARGHHWIAPVLGAALVGSVIYATSSPSYAAPPTVVVVPQPPHTLPSRVAYFCPTAQQYYPNVASCQVPWQPVSY